jgi:hypothetical protein
METMLTAAMASAGVLVCGPGLRNCASPDIASLQTLEPQPIIYMPSAPSIFARLYLARLIQESEYQPEFICILMRLNLLPRNCQQTPHQPRPQSFHYSPERYGSQWQSLMQCYPRSRDTEMYHTIAPSLVPFPCQHDAIPQQSSSSNCSKAVQ